MGHTGKVLPVRLQPESWPDLSRVKGRERCFVVPLPPTFPGCLAAQTPRRSLHKDAEAAAPAKGLRHTGTATHPRQSPSQRTPASNSDFKAFGILGGKQMLAMALETALVPFMGSRETNSSSSRHCNAPPPSFHSRLLAGGQRDGVSPGPSRQVGTPFTCHWRTCPRVGCEPGPLASVRSDSLGLRNDHLL